VSHHQGLPLTARAAARVSGFSSEGAAGIPFDLRFVTPDTCQQLGNVVTGFLARRLVIYEDPAVAEHLEEIAATVGASTASLIRSAIGRGCEQWIRRGPGSSADPVG
jgi:hypothetical protein